MIIVVGLHDSKTGRSCEKRILVRGSYEGIPLNPTAIASCDLYQPHQKDPGTIIHLLAAIQEMAVESKWGDTKNIHRIDEEKNSPTLDYVFENSRLQKPSLRDLFPNGVPSTISGSRRLPEFSCT